MNAQTVAIINFVTISLFYGGTLIYLKFVNKARSKKAPEIKLENWEVDEFGTWWEAT